MRGKKTMSDDEYEEDGSYQEFVYRVFASHEHPANQKRLGQVFFNKLHKERPAIAAHIQGTMFDPFHQEYLHPKVYDVVKELWYEENNKEEN
jgi:hypothetical protein